MDNFPSTRFMGSKAKLVDWIWQNIEDKNFNTVLDAFGGTASFSYLAKAKGKKVYYNDILSFNYNIGLALIENNKKKISNSDCEKVLPEPRLISDKGKIHRNQEGFWTKIKRKIFRIDKIENSKFIETCFDRLYFTQTENRWLDIVATSIHQFRNKYKKAILLSALCQACLIKRPFNLFHRANLYLRHNNVVRSFRNKILWDAPFEEHFRKFTNEFNNAVFNNGQKNKALGGLDIFDLPEDVDLVYLDPPYYSRSRRGNYLDYYHFLEGIVDYENWLEKIDFSSKIKKMKPIEEMSVWNRKDLLIPLFEKMITKFQNSIIVLSYRNDGYPSKYQISKIFKRCKKKAPIVRSIRYKYALSARSTRELLFIAE